MPKFSELSFCQVGNFSNDEQGGGSIKELTWFTLLVGICGLSIIMLDNFHINTVPQASANASAQAAFIDLPLFTTEDPATTTAVEYAQFRTPTDSSSDLAAFTGAVVGEWENPRRSKRLPVSIN